MAAIVWRSTTPAKQQTPPVRLSPQYRYAYAGYLQLSSFPSRTIRSATYHYHFDFQSGPLRVSRLFANPHGPWCDVSCIGRRGTESSNANSLHPASVAYRPSIVVRVQGRSTISMHSQALFHGQGIEHA